MNFDLWISFPISCSCSISCANGLSVAPCFIVTLIVGPVSSNNFAGILLSTWKFPPMCRSLDILLILHLSQVLPPMVVAFPSDLSCEAAIFLVEVFENFGIDLKDVQSVRI